MIQVHCFKGKLLLGVQEENKKSSPRVIQIQNQLSFSS